MPKAIYQPRNGNPERVPTQAVAAPEVTSVIRATANGRHFTQVENDGDGNLLEYPTVPIYPTRAGRPL
jgi:hypothetical protein